LFDSTSMATSIPHLAEAGYFEIAGFNTIYGVALQSDGKILVTGNGPILNGFYTARLHAGGSLDTSFGSSGVVKTSLGKDGYSFSRAVAVQNDGKVIVAGAAWSDNIIVANDFDFAIVRYNVNGTLDSGFANGGKRLIDFGDHERAAAVTIDYNGTPATNSLYGTIVIVGDKSDGEVSPSLRFTIARLTPSGSLDSGFWGGGKLTSANLSPMAREYATDVVIQPGGRIVVSGTAGPLTGGGDNYLMARFQPNGALDSAFGLNGSGVIETDFGSTDLAYGLATGFLGGLLVSGSSGGRLAVAAYTRDGRLDTRFSGDGLLTITGTSGTTRAGIATTGNSILPTRRLVIAGGPGHVARYIDVGSVVSVGTFNPYAYEQGQVPATFIVARTERLATPERVYLEVTGTATMPRPRQPGDYTGSGITFSNSLLHSIGYADIPANETFTVVTITPLDDALVEGDETAIFTIWPHADYDIGTNPTTTIVIRDNDVTGGPVVTSAAFVYETAPQRVTFTFNQDVGASLSLVDFQITGPAGMPSHSFAYNNITNTATLSFSGILPNGNFTARVIASGVTNGSGQAMTADYLLSFFALVGDANRDRIVNIADLGILAANWQGTGKTFSQGDFSYDGIVNIADLGILAANWQKTVPAPLSQLDVLIASDVEPAPTRPPAAAPQARKTPAPIPQDRSAPLLFAMKPSAGQSRLWEFEVPEEEALLERGRK
jgi:uncharacterized delta-60 repeat protein